MTQPPRDPFAPHKRELPDPDENNRPLPWFLIMGLGALLMWGAYYIAETPSGTDSAWGDQRTASALQPEPKGASKKVDGAQVFAAKCAACHQATGLGVPGVFPPLAESEWVLGSPSRLSQILLHGVTGELSVKGVIYKGAMPAFNSLPDAEIAAVLTYIRSAWGNNAAPISSDFIEQQRSKTTSQTAPYAGGAALEALPE